MDLFYTDYCVVSSVPFIDTDQGLHSGTLSDVVQRNYTKPTNSNLFYERCDVGTFVFWISSVLLTDVSRFS